MTSGQPLTAARHPGTLQHLDDLQSGHLPPNLRVIAEPIEALAHQLVDHLQDGPRLTSGLHLLVQAKDALVRQRVADLKAAGATDMSNSPEPALVAIPREETDDDRIVAKMQRQLVERGVDINNG